MRCTDSSLDLVHLSNSERRLASPMASVQSLTAQMWLWREISADPFLNTVPRAPHPRWHTQDHLCASTHGKYFSLRFQDATLGFSVWPPSPEIPIPTEPHFASSSLAASHRPSLASQSPLLLQETAPNCSQDLCCKNFIFLQSMQCLPVLGLDKQLKFLGKQ